MFNAERECRIESGGESEMWSCDVGTDFISVYALLHIETISTDFIKNNAGIQSVQKINRRNSAVSMALLVNEQINKFPETICFLA
jgi:hypothetical protein